jgi:carbon starvation protein
VDPLGGINSLWPLFGISNQLLAAIALCVGTTILIKMGKKRFMWVTVAPLVWLMAVTFTAGYQKVYSPDPKLGFFAAANAIKAQVSEGTLPAGRTVEAAQRMIFNNQLDAVVALIFMGVVIIVVAASVYQWVTLLRGRASSPMTEAPFVPSRLSAAS